MYDPEFSYKIQSDFKKAYDYIENLQSMIVAYPMAAPILDLYMQAFQQIESKYDDYINCFDEDKQDDIKKDILRYFDIMQNSIKQVFLLIKRDLNNE